MSFICHIHNYTDYNQLWNVFPAFGWVKCREHISLLVILCIIVYVTNIAHLSLIFIFIIILQVHTHLEQWAADTAAPGEQLEVRCLAQGSHLSRGPFLPEPRFEPTTSGYKSNTLSIRATTAP